VVVLFTHSCGTYIKAVVVVVVVVVVDVVVVVVECILITHLVCVGVAHKKVIVFTNDGGVYSM